MKSKRKHNSKTKFNRKLCRTCFCKSSPMVVSDKDWIKTILYKGERYKFEYINENGNIKIVSFSRVESNSESQINLKSCRSYFSSKHKKHAFARTRYAKIYKTFEEHENRKRIFDEHLELCRRKVTDAQVNGACFVGFVKNVENSKNMWIFDLYYLNHIYKCVLLKSKYSKKIDTPHNNKEYYIGGFLVDDTVYVIFLHKRSKKEKRVRHSKTHLTLMYAKRIKGLERRFNSTINYEEK